MPRFRAAYLLSLLAILAPLAANPATRAADPPPPAPPVLPPGLLEAPHRLPDAQSLLLRANALSDEEITAAISKGADALLAKLNRDVADARKTAPSPPSDGEAIFRDTSLDHRNGEIALGLYALLNVHHITGDPKYHFTAKEMAGPIQYLLTMRSRFTYVVALQASALSLLPNRPEFRKPLVNARLALLQSCMDGAYTYEAVPQVVKNAGDNSNTQYGQLGVWACQDAGLEVPLSYWESANQHWRSSQCSAGGWGYISVPQIPNSPANAYDFSIPTMTTAGVASLFLAHDELDREVSFNPRPDKGLDAGIKWLGEHFEQFRLLIPTDLYLAYGVERVGLAGGLKFLGSHDWYREGAGLILDAQQPDGLWPYDRGSTTCGTAYALLFLARGIAPVACAKLQYDGPWNARSRDCARLTSWLTKKTERPLNWQFVSVDSDPEEWRNVPVLLITGHGDPKFTPEQILRLRRYVLNGGLIFSSADQGDANFSKLIRQKYAPAILEDNYEMRALPPDHPAFQLDYKVDKPKEPHLFGLSNGVREVWIHSDDDLAADWQGYHTSKAEAFEVPANIYFYATGRSSVPLRLEPLAAPEPPAATFTLNIARLAYSGNWDPEPAAWQHFATAMRQQHGAILNFIPTRITDLDPAKTPLAHITGTTALSLTDEQKQKLAEFLAHGGTLLADAAGGSEDFATSFKTTLASIVTDAALTDLPATSPVLTGKLSGGQPLATLDTRRFTDLPPARDRTITLMEVQRAGKPVVIFSHADLTAGVGGLRTWGILGYTPDTTTALAWNALLYLARPPLAAATPATLPAPAPSTHPAP